jgi:hypothetical protein
MKANYYNHTMASEDAQGADLLPHAPHTNGRTKFTHQR